jgi:hypothetical protein
VHSKEEGGVLLGGKKPYLPTQDPRRGIFLPRLESCRLSCALSPSWVIVVRMGGCSTPQAARGSAAPEHLQTRCPPIAATPRRCPACVAVIVTKLPSNSFDPFPSTACAYRDF